MRWKPGGVEPISCSLLGPSLSGGRAGTSEKQGPFLFLSRVPLGRPFSVFLIKAGKTEQKHVGLYFSPHFSSPGIILNKHFIFHSLSFIAIFTIPDLSLLFRSQIVPKAQYFSGGMTFCFPACSSIGGFYFLQLTAAPISVAHHWIQPLLFSSAHL